MRIGRAWSVVFARPAYQRRIGLSGSFRSIPDASLQLGGCPSGISASCGADDSASVVADGVGIGGGFFGVIGTSASSPEFAGLLALEVAATHQRLGNVNPQIYGTSQDGNAQGGDSQDGNAQGPGGPLFHSGIPGSNGVVTESAATSRYYSPIVGRGTPYAANFIGLSGQGLAGVPQTLTNP